MITYLRGPRLVSFIPLFFSAVSFLIIPSPFLLDSPRVMSRLASHQYERLHTEFISRSLYLHLIIYLLFCFSWGHFCIAPIAFIFGFGIYGIIPSIMYISRFGDSHGQNRALVELKNQKTIT